MVALKNVDFSLFSITYLASHWLAIELYVLVVLDFILLADTSFTHSPVFCAAFVPALLCGVFSFALALKILAHFKLTSVCGVRSMYRLSYVWLFIFQRCLPHRLFWFHCEFLLPLSTLTDHVCRFTSGSLFYWSMCPFLLTPHSFDCYSFGI